jgi:murein DD-endopeptidase MepM/ murein hydrolase activator NlpD
MRLPSLAAILGLALALATPASAQSPAAAAAASARTDPPPTGDPPPGAPDEAESEEDAEPEPIDIRELRPVARPRVPRPAEQKAKARKAARPKGDKACDFRVPLYEHEVVDGEMVSSIAARYGVRVKDIKKLNPRLDINKIRIGQKLKVCPEIAPRLREEFTYAVKKGDTLSEIGEKYGLTPREIVKLQKPSLRARLEKNRSDLRLTDELTLIVDRGILPEFAPPEEDRGTLKVGVQLEPGKAYFIKRPHLAYGTTHTVKAIKAAVSRYKQAKAGKGGPEIHIGDISARGGGPLKGHKSHQKGIDVDIGLVLKGADADETRFRTGREDNLDVARTWALIKAFIDTDEVRAVFLDYKLQKLLYEHARKQKVNESTLDELFQYPRGKGRNFGIIRHWKGHKDHFHVRFKR